MMKLNINNGLFQFGKWVITAKEQIHDLKSKFLSENLELWIDNDEWITYRLDISDKFILMIRFFNELIYSIEIYPKNAIDGDRKKVLNEILEKLGGKNKYSWGNVELNIDHKASYESILINYSS